MKSGNIILQSLSAKLDRDTGVLTKMNPYVIFKLGGNNFKTDVAKGMNLAPSWKNEFTMKFLGEDVLYIEVWDQGVVKDDLVGEGSIRLSDWINKGSGTFSQPIPLSFKGLPAGQLFLKMNFSPISAGMQQQAPIVHKEEVRVTEPAAVIKERPIVYEKEIVREQPLITEKQTIESVQPVIVKKPELHETVIKQTAPTEVISEKPVLKTETASMGEKPLLEGKPIVHKESEFHRETPIVTKERPELFKKEVVTEQPIIHQKDIINVEKPVIHERPEIIQKQYDVKERDERVGHQAIIHSEKVETRTGPLPTGANVHAQQAEVRQQAPTFVKETPEVFEKKVIHEKPIVHEQPIVHAEKEILHERPEVLQTRILHQEKPIVETKPMVHEKHEQQQAQQPATLVTERTTKLKTQPKGDTLGSAP